jgi:uncharacterized protein YbjT (DUF2867 family)
VRRPQLAEFLRVAGDVGQVVPVQANLRYPDSVAAAVAGSDGVVNATGIFFQRGRQTYQAVHVDGTRQIAQAAKAAGVQRVVHISGIGADDRGSANRFIRSKAEAEEAITAGFPAATILRPSVVFGPEDRFFNTLAATLRLAPVLPLFGDGSARLQPVYVGDVARAAGRVLAQPDAPFAVYELGGPKIYTYREAIELLFSQVGRRRPLLRVPVPLARFAAMFAEWLPVPPITRDQVDLMTRDNVVRAGARGFAELGLEPVAADVILPSYVDRFRERGRYSLTTA